jgi:hypothetical protein
MSYIAMFFHVLAYFPYFERIEVAFMRTHSCLNVPPHKNFSMPEPILMKLGMALEPISTAYFINPFLQLYQHCSLSNYCSYSLNVA